MAICPLYATGNFKYWEVYFTILAVMNLTMQYNNMIVSCGVSECHYLLENLEVSVALKY